jgi:5-hydroxyisourate hydrolase-like protein (transthyretin family)
MILRIASSLLVVFGLFQQVPATVPPAQSFRITGTVVDALSGQPLSHAQVLINLQTEQDSTQATTTGDDGRFAFENLAPGTYALSAERKGYVDQAYKQHESFSTAMILGPDRQPGDLRFELRPDASVSGRVFDETNEPLRNAQVMLLRQDLRQGRRATRQQGQIVTDDLGRYHFGHQPAGTYFVSVSAHPWYAEPMARQHPNPHPAADVFVQAESGDPALDVTYPVTFFPNATELSAASPINLRPGDAEIADITLRPVPAIHVVIRYSPSTESPQVWVQQAIQHIAPGIDQGLGVQTTQSEPGVFEIMGLPPGQVSLGFGSSKGNQSTSHSQTVQLSGDSEINVTDLPPSTTVSGIVAMDDGSPLTQPASVRLRSPSTGAVFDAQLQPNGEFSFNGQGIPPGTYAVGVARSGASAVHSISATGAKVSGRTVEIGSSPDVQLSVVVSKGTGTVKGFALKDGKPVDGVMVVLVPQDPEHNLVLFRRDQSDSDGSFNLRGILSGKYTVVAIENGWDLEWSSPGVLQKYLARGEKIQVTPNAKLEVKVNVQQ